MAVEHVVVAIVVRSPARGRGSSGIWTSSSRYDGVEQSNLGFALTKSDVGRRVAVGQEEFRDSKDSEWRQILAYRRGNLEGHLHVPGSLLVYMYVRTMVERETGKAENWDRETTGNV